MFESAGEFMEEEGNLRERKEVFEMDRDMFC